MAGHCTGRFTGKVSVRVSDMADVAGGANLAHARRGGLLVPNETRATKVRKDVQDAADGIDHATVVKLLHAGDSFGERARPLLASPTRTFKHQPPLPPPPARSSTLADRSFIRDGFLFGEIGGKLANECRLDSRGLLQSLLRWLLLKDK